MRRRVTIVCIWVGVALAAAWADTIHLKNGRSIVADRVRENGGRYEYEIGDDSYAIPKGAVDHIDTGGSPTRGIDAASSPNLPIVGAGDSLQGEGDLVAKVIKDGKVDSDALAVVENKGNPEISAAADFLAGKFELEHGN